MKPAVPERDSSLYECVATSQGFQTFRSVSRNSCQTRPFGQLNGRNEMRRNSNSSSNEADEESSLSSLNSNQFVCPAAGESTTSDEPQTTTNLLFTSSSLTVINTNFSTFKSSTMTSTSTSANPARPSDVKRRSNGRKQPSTIGPTNNSNPSLATTTSEPNSSTPPPPPPLPVDFNEERSRAKPSSSSSSSSPTDFQNQIEEAKNRLKKIDAEKNENDEGKNESLHSRRSTSREKRREGQLVNPQR